MVRASLIPMAPNPELVAELSEVIALIESAFTTDRPSPTQIVDKALEQNTISL